MYLSVAALYYVWDGKTFCFGSTLSQRNLCKTCFMIWVLLFRRPCLCTTPSDGIIRKILGSNTQGLNKINMHDWKAYFWLPNLRFFFRKKEKKAFFPWAEELHFSERRHLKLLVTEEFGHRRGWLEQSVISRGSSWGICFLHYTVVQTRNSDRNVLAFRTITSLFVHSGFCSRCGLGALVELMMHCCSVGVRTSA